MNTKRPVPQICKPRLSMLRNRLFNLRNMEARRSISQFGQDASKIKSNRLSRSNRVVTWWKIILLKITLLTYFRIAPSKIKVRLFFSGAKRSFGTRIEQKLLSAIKDKLNVNSGMPQTPKFAFKSHIGRKQNKDVTRNRRTTIGWRHQGPYFTLNKSRNLEQHLRTKRASVPGLNSSTPAPQESYQIVVMSPKKK